MNNNINMVVSLIPGLGMMIVAVAAVIFWRRVSHLKIRWFWFGALLWTVAVILKVVCALLTNEVVIRAMKENMPYPVLVVAGGLFMGIQSSVFEIGFTFLAVLIWQKLGQNANRAIGIGIGAGAFEASLLGITSLIAVVAMLAGVPGTERVHQGIETAAAVTPLFWLLAPAERIMAILCHASSRTLVFLGGAHRKYLLVLWGFILFTLLDGVAGGAHLAGNLGTYSMWWIELAILPFALASILILRWCYVHWPCLPEGRQYEPSGQNEKPHS